MRPELTSVRRRLFILFIVLAVSSVGCRPSARETAGSGDSGMGGAQSAENGSPAAVGTPRDVARLALDAIAANDMPALSRLVAAERVRRDLEAITRGRGDFQNLVDNAVATAATAIRTAIESLDSQPREIGGESITGDRATVTIKGLRGGKPQTRTLYFVRENGAWKLVPSHR